ncbi:helicase associated domain-containing protein [Streptomyces camelliae]|uniref:helicase associated domain-containing protein n=1 Tax=Streptomyces camelliae TaxID=3004093 RepID=UPI003D175596
MLSVERYEQLEEIAPSWCPAWPVEWQRCFHQQWMCEHILGIQPAAEEEEPRPRFRLGAGISDQRSRAATLTPERIQQLSDIGTRWT